MKKALTANAIIATIFATVANAQELNTAPMQCQNLDTGETTAFPNFPVGCCPFDGLAAGNATMCPPDLPSCPPRWISAWAGEDEEVVARLENARRILRQYGMNRRDTVFGIAAEKQGEVLFLPVSETDDEIIYRLEDATFGRVRIMQTLSD
ncbi:MAG: hypothetical protein F4X97_01270 [Boseongicola sp. SB0662_bin_57]|nr:hypothetical protein [Boseongicola sp. SB0662_bin_57]